MKKLQEFKFSKALLAALSIGLMVVGAAQAQRDIPAFTGKFTLTTRVLWDKAVLQPGDYSITITSGSMPISALIRDSKGRPVGLFVTGIDEGKTSAGDALLIREKGGQLRVYSLALASLGRVLVYDPALARGLLMEARAPQTVPLMSAKR